MELDNKMIGERLKELRVDHGLTIREVAEYLGLSEGMYCNIELGKRRLKYVHRLEKLCQLYNCDEDYILCKHDEHNVYGSIAYNLYVKEQ